MPLDIEQPEALNPITVVEAPTPTGTVVASYSALAAELALAGPRVIVVAAGTYSGTYLTTNQGHHIWAREGAGSVTFEFGIGFRGNSGVRGGGVHGIDFDVSSLSSVDPTAVGNEGIINTWDSVSTFDIGADLVIEDCTFNGNGVIGSGVQAANPSGLTVRRCSFSNLIDYGVYAYRPASAHDDLDLITIEDCTFSNISRSVAGSASGGGELAVLIGQDFVAQRLYIRDCAWAGVGLVNDCTGVLTDVDADDIGWGFFNPGSVGVYCEECHDVFMRRILCGPNMKVAVNCEWNSGDPDPYVNSMVPRNYGIHIRHLTSYAYKVGVGFDLSVRGCTVAWSRFERSWKAGVLDNNQFPDDDGSYPAGSNDPIVSYNAVDITTCEFFLNEDVPGILHDHHGGAAAAAPAGWPATPAAYDNSNDVEWVYGRRESTLPEVDWVSPLPGGELSTTGSIVVDVTDRFGVASCVIMATFTRDGRRIARELVYDVDGFDPDYAGSTRDAITAGHRYTLRRSQGWPVDTSVSIKAIPVDQSGN